MSDAFDWGKHAVGSAAKWTGGALGDAGTALFGDGKDTGLLGTGHERFDNYAVNKDAVVNDPNAEKNKAMLEAGYAASQGRQAPQMGPVTLGPAATGTAGSSQAATVGGLERMTAAQAGPAALMNAADPGEIERAKLSQMKNAVINRAQDEQMRAYQIDLANELKKQAAGSGVGQDLAGEGYRKANAQNVKNLMGTLAAQGGTISPALAQKLLFDESANVEAQNAQNLVSDKMKAALTAQDQLAGIANTTRGQDIGVNTSQAGFEQDASTNNMNAANTNSMFNAGQYNDMAKLKAQLAQEASRVNAGATNDISLANAGFRQGASQFNAGQFNQGTFQNADMAQQSNLLNAQMQQQVLLANLSAMNQNILAQGQMSLAQKQANLEAQLKMQGMNDAQAQFYAQKLLEKAEADRQAAASYEELMAGQKAGMNALEQKAYESAAARKAGTTAGILQGGVSLGTAAASKSDERAKTSIEPASISGTSKASDDWNRRMNQMKANTDAFLKSNPDNFSRMGAAFGSALSLPFMMKPKDDIAASEKYTPIMPGYLGQGSDAPEIEAPIEQSDRTQKTGAIAVSDAKEKQNAFAAGTELAQKGNEAQIAKAWEEGRAAGAVSGPTAEPTASNKDAVKRHEANLRYANELRAREAMSNPVQPPKTVNPNEYHPMRAAPAAPIVMAPGTSAASPIEQKFNILPMRLDQENTDPLGLYAGSGNGFSPMGTLENINRETVGKAVHPASGPAAAPGGMNAQGFAMGLANALSASPAGEKTEITPEGTLGFGSGESIKRTTDAGGELGKQESGYAPNASFVQQLQKDQAPQAASDFSHPFYQQKNQARFDQGPAPDLNRAYSDHQIDSMMNSRLGALNSGWEKKLSDMGSAFAAKEKELRDALAAQQTTQRQTPQAPAPINFNFQPEAGPTYRAPSAAGNAPGIASQPSNQFQAPTYDVMNTPTYSQIRKELGPTPIMQRPENMALSSAFEMQPINYSPSSFMNRDLTVLSDKKQKKAINNLNEDMMNDFLDKLQAYTYEYKDPDMPGAGHGRFLSPMAQDLEASDIGKSAVKEDSNGIKMVDYGKLGGITLAGLSMVDKRQHEQDERLGEVEAALSLLAKKRR